MTARRREALIAAALLLLLLTSSVRAKPQMQVEIGWGNNYRLGAWNPIFLTVSDPVNQQVVMELLVPHGGADAMQIRQGFAIGPMPVTYALYTPLPQTYQLAESTITLRNPRNNKRLEDGTVPLADPYGQFSPSGQAITPNQIWSGQTFIGHTGRSATREGFEQQFSDQRITVGHLPTIRLPDVAVGYECLDALVLDAPNFSKMTLDQQRAIADWVRAGGTVIMWASEDPIPESGPLIDILPVRFGENRTIEIPANQVKALKVRDRFTKLRTRDVTPASGAEAVKFFDTPAATGYRSTVGLGQVFVLPFDAASLQFSEEAAELTFWRKALKDVVELPPEEDATNSGNSYAYRGFGMEDQRRQQAMTHALDWLGDIPGAGAFGFSYVAFMLIGMMVIVGPVDWFVLKWLGRQPWTWVTTSGWIALVTLGAIFIGNLLKSGELHYRTVRLIDQIDGVTEADLSVAGVYSPSTTTYDLACDPESWWQPASETMYYGRQGRAVELPSHQDYRGTRPTALPVNIWNLRFIEGQKLAADAPMIAAELSATNQRVTGTIKNLAAAPLTDVRIRTSGGMAKFAGPPIAPGQSVEIDLKLDGRGTVLDSYSPMDAIQVSSTNWQNPSGQFGGPEPSAWSLAGLAPKRSGQLDKLLKRGGRACVYATMVSPTPTVELKADGILHKHMAVVRAVVPLR